MNLVYKRFEGAANEALASMERDFVRQRGATPGVREFSEKEKILDGAKALVRDLLADPTAVFSVPDWLLEEEGAPETEGAPTGLLTRPGLTLENGSYPVGIIITGGLIQIGSFASFIIPQLITGAVGYRGSWTFVRRS